MRPTRPGGATPRRPRRAPAVRRPLLVATIGIALAACSSPAPRYERPAAPVAGRFPDSAAALPAATPASDIPWQQFFAAPRLNAAIGLALRNNRDLRVAALNIEQAAAQAAVRNADLWPTIGVGVGALRQPTASGGISSLYSGGFSVTAYEFDLFGRLRGLSDAAAAQVLASAEARAAVQISLIGEVASTWLSLQADDELLGLTRRTLATREESLRLTRLRYDHGASSAIDLRAAESLREAARASLAGLVRQRAGDENALVLLIGQPLPADLAPLPADAAAPPFAELPAGLPSQVLIRRPDVRQAEFQLIAANADIGAARAAFFPKITLTGSLGSASGELSGLFKAGSFAWSFAPQLLQPVFDAGRNRANLRLAELGRDVAVATYEKAIQSAFREVADALAGRATLSEQEEAQQAEVQAEEDLVALAELRDRQGATSALERLDAERALYAAQIGLIQVRLQRAQNGVTLYRVLGGGWTRSADGPGSKPP